MNSIWGRWAPPYERSKLVTFTYAGKHNSSFSEKSSVTANPVTKVYIVNRLIFKALHLFLGTTIGNILTLSLSGFMCESDVDGGWPLLFYVFGE